ncbi:MAG: hypothetical protein D6722_21010 [Bacteroidetes bacterium]|nr:MAG: hypothetical protein D6722_21010 [Bacteroidota bacterium]
MFMSKLATLVCLLLLGEWGIGLPTGSVALAQTWQTPFERSQGQASATYAEAIAYYQRLAEAYPEVHIEEAGPTDIGRPLHAVVVSDGTSSNPADLRRAGNRILLILNGIHPGEPCGIDASMMLARDLVQQAELQPLLQRLAVVIVPVYNIGGALNRGDWARTNQVGPVAYGFRGNARNLDLNRDFIKADSRNARSFARLFHRWQPDLFIDTHTTNGADYPAVLTYIYTHPDKLPPALATYQQERLIPHMSAHMAEAGIPISPYVNVFGRTPDDGGMAAFLDLPRYASGYAALFQTLSVITEAHMLKPFSERVEATYHFLLGVAQHMNANHEALAAAIAAGKAEVRATERFAIHWETDRERVDSLLFHGYEGRYRPSAVTGQPRLYYDHSAPYQRNIPYYPYLKETTHSTRPVAYLIPQAYPELVERLQANAIQLRRLSQDTVLTVEVSYIDAWESRSRPYEGHFFHDKVTVRRDTQAIACYQGDWVAYTDQSGVAFLMHVLEPEAADSYFRWNFFDGILMRKEYYSAYVFEDEAAEMLAEDPVLRAAFAAEKARDSAFAASPWRQLTYLYEHSRHSEPTYTRYPVYRWWGSTALPLE